MFLLVKHRLTHYNTDCTYKNYYIGINNKVYYLPQATKCSNHYTISLITHTAKTVAKILRRRMEKKIEDVLGEDQFGFRRGKRTRGTTGMLRIILE
jgi:hypothetical protein